MLSVPQLKQKLFQGIAILFVQLRMHQTTLNLMAIQT